MCQYFVELVLRPAHTGFPQAYIFHYMDYILLAYSNEREPQEFYEYVMACLPEAYSPLTAPVAQGNETVICLLLMKSTDPFY